MNQNRPRTFSGDMPSERMSNALTDSKVDLVNAEEKWRGPPDFMRSVKDGKQHWPWWYWVLLFAPLPLPESWTLPIAIAEFALWWLMLIALVVMAWKDSS